MCTKRRRKIKLSAKTSSGKERRQREATERKTNSDLLTPQQRLDNLNARGYRAEKERNRLLELINKKVT